MYQNNKDPYFSGWLLDYVIRSEYIKNTTVIHIQFNTENHTENLNSTENPWKSMKLDWILIQKKYTLKELWKSHWKFVFVIQELIFALC